MHEKWEQVKEILALALEQSPEERADFIRRACGDDRTLLSEVESLASFHDGADSLLEDSPAARPPAFPPDAMIGRRVGAYRIVSLIGQGGMAVVYLGVRDDEQFRRSVAIKMVPPGPNTEEIFQRFRNERQTLAALDHPHIVKLLDGGSTEEGLPYLVMDFVDGVPIDQSCDQRHLSIEQRLRLFCAVCSAVQYAHDRLVIHRDLKPGNILITKDGTPRLLDFGIAKLLSSDLIQTPLVTRTSWRPMTPRYASPEQIRGQSVTKATDVYSLGVLLWELLTGHRPYRSEGRSLLEIERAVCEEETELPSSVVCKTEPSHSSDLDITPEFVAKNRDTQPARLRRRLRGDLDTIVMKALRKEPENRYLSAAELAEDLERHLAGKPILACWPTIAYRAVGFARRHKESLIPAIVALGVILAMGIYALRVSRRSALSQVASAVQTRARPSLAILGFRNLSNHRESGWISTALSEMLAANLAAGEELRIIPGETVFQSERDLVLPNLESIAPKKLEQLRQNLGADFVILGSYIQLVAPGKDQVRLDLRLEDASKKETVATVSEMGTTAQLLDLVSQTSALLRERLGLSKISPMEAEQIQASFPSNAGAMRSYAEGLAESRAFKALAARDFLVSAVSADSEFPLAHSALARVWQTLGYDSKAEQEAKKALDGAQGLSREEELLLEARYYEAAMDWQRAVDAYRTLFNLFPDSVDYGLALAHAQSSGGKGREALATLAAIVRANNYAKEDPRVDLATSEAASSIGDDRLRRDAADSAAVKADRLGAKLIKAQARNLECRALANLGENARARSICDEAIQLYAQTGDRGGLARSMHNAAEVPLNQGDFASAEELYRQALSILQKIGDKKSTGSELVNLGLIAVKRGDFAKGHKLYEQSLRNYQEAGDKQGIAVVTGDTGNLLRSEGRLSEAIAHYQTTLKLSNELGHRGSAALALQAIGDVLTEEGDLAGAYTKYQQAMKIQQEIGARSNYADSLVSIGKVFRQQARNEEALGEFEKALAIQEQLGEKGSVAETQLAMAELDCDSNHPADAEHLARSALSQFQAQREPVQQISALILIARSALQEGRMDLARDSVSQARRLSARTPDVLRGLALQISSAYLQAGLKDFRSAQAAASQARARAKRLGLIRLYLEASLALGEFQIEGSQHGAGHELLQSVTKSARSKGFERIARLASAAT